LDDIMLEMARLSAIVNNGRRALQPTAQIA
jgi:hypothetical protein